MIDSEQKREIVKDILLFIAGGAILSAAIVAPGSTELFKLFQKKRKKPIDHRVFYSALRQMRREKLVSWSEVGDILELSLTKSGKRRSISYQMDNIVLNEPAKWDSIWRIVMFDIPETKKTNRDIFRTKLKSLGFTKLQKSTWISPIPCRDQVVFLAHILEIDPYVVFLETKQMDLSPSSNLRLN